MQVKSLDHIHIYSETPEESAEFYIRHFNAKPVAGNKNINGDQRIFLALGGQIVVVGSFPSGQTAKAPPAVGDGAYRHGFGVAHFGLRIESVERGLEELAKADVPILGERIQEESGLIYAYIAGPDGVVIELTEYESKAAS